MTMLKMRYNLDYANGSVYWSTVGRQDVTNAISYMRWVGVPMLPTSSPRQAYTVYALMMAGF